MRRRRHNGSTRTKHAVMNDLLAIGRQGGVVLALLLLLIANHAAPAVAQLAPRCGAGLELCPLGRWGLGGCFKTSDAQCTNGLICPKGSEACPPGSDGPGGCVIQGQNLSERACLRYGPSGVPAGP